MNVYLDAAGIIFNREEEFSCNAIDSALDWTSSTYWRSLPAKNFARLFKPTKEVHPECGWGVRWGEDIDTRQECRVIALCFAAAMHETGDL